MNRRVVECGTVVLCLVACILTRPAAAIQDRPTERVAPSPQCNANAVVWRTPEPPKDPQAGDVWVNPKDGMEMVYVSAGEFILGTSDAQMDAWLKEREWVHEEQPQCRVNLPGYWIGRTEVSNGQYLRFVQSSGYRPPYYWEGGRVPAGLESFPVIAVERKDARAYCEWAGGHVPTELQWEKAARGTDGRIFPWGNEWDSKRCRNFGEIAGNENLRDWRAHHDAVREGPAAVGSYPTGASAYGCLDMAGNVFEWCADLHDVDAYKRYAQGDLSPASGTRTVLRGGAWNVVGPWFFRCAYRSANTDLDTRDVNIGFRCARDATP